MIVHTYYGINKTKKTAEQFRLALAVERGYSSEITKIDGGHRVTASDGKSVEFVTHQAPSAKEDV